jgi:hypothetical protein
MGICLVLRRLGVIIPQKSCTQLGDFQTQIINDQNSQIIKYQFSNFHKLVK